MFMVVIQMIVVQQAKIRLLLQANEDKQLAAVFMVVTPPLQAIL